MNNSELLCKLRAEFDEIINSISFTELVSPALVEQALRLELRLSDIQ